MAITLDEARSLEPDVHVVHFGDEDTLYIVKAVGYGYNMPVKVLVERYPEHVEGLETFFTDLQLDLVTIVGEAKADEAKTPDAQATPTGDPCVESPQTPDGAPCDERIGTDEHEAGDPSADATGRDAHAQSDTADTPLEVPRAEESWPREGPAVREDLDKPARKRPKYKGG